MDKMPTSSRRQLSFPGGAICKLCQGHHSHMSSPVDWKNEQACTYLLSVKVPSDSLVCHPCRHDVTRVLPNPCYVPRCSRNATILIYVHSNENLFATGTPTHTKIVISATTNRMTSPFAADASNVVHPRNCVSV